MKDVKNTSVTNIWRFLLDLEEIANTCLSIFNYQQCADTDFILFKGAPNFLVP